MADQYGGDIYDRLIMYRRARRKFAVRVFLLATFFILLAVIQWLPLFFVPDLRDGIREHYYISFVVFFCALLAVTVFIFFERLRFWAPINWILTIFIVECVIWGLARAVAESELMHFGMSFAVVALVVILMLIIGAYCTHDLTVDVVLLFVGSIVLFLGAIFFVLLHIVANIQAAVYFYLSFVVIMILVFLMYHSQTIVGGRYSEMRIIDYLLAALIIFNDFVVLFALTFYLASHITKERDDERK